MLILNIEHVASDFRAHFTKKKNFSTHMFADEVYFSVTFQNVIYRIAELTST